MFELYPHQVDHVTRLLEVMDSSFFAMDLSMLGAGKTFTSTRVADVLGVANVIVIAPVSVKPKWSTMARDHGLKLKHCMSFNELRSSICRQPKHGLLARRDYKTQMLDSRSNELIDIDKVEFSPTPELERIAAEGCLLIIDEIQNIKNLSTQFHAARTMIAAMAAHENSRVLMVSGSPIDKREQAVHLFRCLGIMKSSKLCDFDLATYRYRPVGFKEIREYCNKLDPDAELEVRRELVRARKTHGFHRGMDAAACEKAVYALFQRCFKTHMACAMDPPKNPDVVIEKRNGYFEISRDKKQLLSRGVRTLSDVSSFDPTTGGVSYGSNGADTVVAITQALMMIETAKVPTFARLARETLKRDDTSKVVLCLNYCATLDDLVIELADLAPLVMRGSMSAEKRGLAMSSFQEPNSTNRLLIGNVSVLSTGIDLDDKHGSFKRTAFVSPTYNTITIYQLSHRFLRLDTKSSSSLFMVYGKHASETRVIDALSKKSQVMKETTQQQVEMGVEFPGDYKAFVEGRS